MLFQAPASVLAERIVLFHDHLMMFVVGIFMVVAIGGGYAVVSWKDSKNPLSNWDALKENEKSITHGPELEFVWTIIPIFILALILGPSFALLYANIEVDFYQTAIRLIGHQWYWTYLEWNYEEKPEEEISSIIKPIDDLKIGEKRLLEVDQSLNIVQHELIRGIVGSEDVIHTWTLPALGVKMDATPGRLNAVLINPYRAGTFYGMCSELCGINHSQMPIKVRVEQK